MYYCKVFEIKPITLDDLIKVAKYADIKDIIYSTIISFTELFYYDDQTGASLFERKIADCKGK